MKKFALRFRDEDEHLFDKLKKIADENRKRGSSINTEIMRAIELYLEAQEKEVVKKKSKSPQ